MLRSGSIPAYPAASMGKISSVQRPSLPRRLRKSLRVMRASASTWPPTMAATSSPLIRVSCTEMRSLEYASILVHSVVCPNLINHILHPLSATSLCPVQSSGPLYSLLLDLYGSNEILYVSMWNGLPLQSAPPSSHVVYPHL